MGTNKIKIKLMNRMHADKWKTSKTLCGEKEQSSNHRLECFWADLIAFHLLMIDPFLGMLLIELLLNKLSPVGV